MVKGVDGISAMIKECTVKEPKKRPDFPKLETRIREIEARVADQPAISRTQSLKPGMRSGSSGEAPFLKELRRGDGGGLNTMGASKASGTGTITSFSTGTGAGAGTGTVTAGGAGGARAGAAPKVAPRSSSMRRPADGGGAGDDGSSPRSRSEASKAFELQFDDADGGGREGEYFNMRTPGGTNIPDRNGRGGGGTVGDGGGGAFFGSDA